MEGLIPFVYRAIVEYKNGNNKEDLLGSWFNESPSASYMRLPGDSGRFQSSDIQLFRADFGLASSATSSSSTTTTTTTPAAPNTSQIMVSTGVHSPVRRRVAA